MLFNVAIEMQKVSKEFETPFSKSKKAQRIFFDICFPV